MIENEGMVKWIIGSFTCCQVFPPDSKNHQVETPDGTLNGLLTHRFIGRNSSLCVGGDKGEGGLRAVRCFHLTAL